MELDHYEEAHGLEYLPKSYTLSEINLQLFQEFLWYQIDQNIPTLHVNREGPAADKRSHSKDPQPTYSFQQVFTLESSVLVCKVVDRRLLLSKRNIYHKNRVKQFKGMTTSFSNFTTPASSYSSTEYDVFLQFPNKLVRDLICVEFERGNPVLLVPSSVGVVYIIPLKDLHSVIRKNEQQFPSLELEISHTLITQLVKSNEKHPYAEKEGLLLAANCSNAAVYFFQVPQLFEELNRRVNFSYDIRLTKNILTNLLSSIIVKQNERDSLATLQYISHRIMVGVTKNNIIKVLNLHKRGTVLEYKIDHTEIQEERDDDASEICLRALPCNPLIQNDKINFLIAFCRLQSTVHKYVKLFNLSFRVTHKKRRIFKLNEIHTHEDLGTSCELSMLATYDTPNMITSLDLNIHGLAVSSYDDTDCNSELHHLRFSMGKVELSNSLFSKVAEIRSFDEKRSNMLRSDIAPEDVTEILANNPELLPTDSIIQAMRANNIIFDQSIMNLKPLDRRAELLGILQANWENGSLGEIAMLRLFQDCFLKSKDNTKIEGVFLSKDQDFPPVILRNRVVSIAIKGDPIESLNLMHKYNCRKELGIEILSSLELENPEYFENFLLLLSFFKKSTGSYTAILQSYLDRDYENVSSMVEEILAEIEPEFTSENQAKFAQLLSDLTENGTKLTSLCDQLRQLLVNALDIDREADSADNIHLIDSIDIWSYSTLDLLCGIARQRVKHYLELCLDVSLMIQYINTNPATAALQRIDQWAARPFEDYIQSMMSFLVLMNFSPDLSNLSSKSEHKEIADVISNFSTIDTFTYFVIFEYKKYLGNTSSYHLVEPQDWVNKICAKLIRKISFDPRYERIDVVPEIVSFLLRFKEYETALIVIEKMFYKNPAIEFAKAECLYNLARYGEMMSSLFYVASYINQEAPGSKSRASIYTSYWHNKGSDYLKSVSERITASLCSPLTNFLLNTMKYSFCSSQNIAAGIASTALYLKDIDSNSLILFLKEIISVYKKENSFEPIYNFIHMFPKHDAGFQREYIGFFRSIVHDLIAENQLKKLIEFPLDHEAYEIVSGYLEDHLRQECENMVYDFESKLHNPEDIYDKFNKSYALYHKIVSFFLEKELYKQAGYIMLSYFESLSLLDNSFKSLKKLGNYYLKVLQARLSLINEAIYCLEVSEDQYGYIIIKSKDNTRHKGTKRNYAGLIGNKSLKENGAGFGFGRKRDLESASVIFGLEETPENGLSEEEHMVLNEKSLAKYRELLSARILLEEREALSIPETDYMIPENVTRIGKYLVALGELDRVVDFCSAFGFAIQEVVPFMAHMYFFNPEPNFGESEFNESLWKILSQTESHKGVYVRNVIAEAILQQSEDKYGYSIPLPSFLIDEFREKDPIQLTRIYLDFDIYEEAVKTLVLAIERNREMLNKRETRQVQDISDKVHYIDPDLFQQVVAYLDDLQQKGETRVSQAKLEQLLGSVENAFRVCVGCL